MRTNHDQTNTHNGHLSPSSEGEPAVIFLQSTPTHFSGAFSVTSETLA